MERSWTFKKMYEHALELYPEEFEKITLKHDCARQLAPLIGLEQKKEWSLIEKIRWRDFCKPYWKDGVKDSVIYMLFYMKFKHNREWDKAQNKWVVGL